VFSCDGQNKKDKAINNSQYTTQQNDKASSTAQVFHIPNIPLASVDSLNFKIKSKILKNNIKGVSLNSCNDFNDYYYSAIDGLFVLEDIKRGVYYRNAGSILVYDIYYSNNQSKIIFENIKKTIIETEDYNTYHDYLKTGKVFILDRDKITVLHYNPFSNSKIHDAVDKFLKANISYFTGIIRVYGMNNVEIIK
jgi:hypothetical protein